MTALVARLVKPRVERPRVTMIARARTMRLTMARLGMSRMVMARSMVARLVMTNRRMNQRAVVMVLLRLHLITMREATTVVVVAHRRMPELVVTSSKHSLRHRMLAATKPQRALSQTTMVPAPVDWLARHPWLRSQGTT